MEAFGRLWAFICTSLIQHGGIRGPKIGPNEQVYNFWALFVHLHITKVRNDYIFGSTNLWRLLGEHRPSNELQPWYVELWSGSEGPKNMVKTTRYMTFWHLLYISVRQKLQMITFSVSTNLWRLLEEVLDPIYYTWTTFKDSYSQNLLKLVLPKYLIIFNFR